MNLLIKYDSQYKNRSFNYDSFFNGVIKLDKLASEIIKTNNAIFLGEKNASLLYDKKIEDLELLQYLKPENFTQENMSYFVGYFANILEIEIEKIQEQLPKEKVYYFEVNNIIPFEILKKMVGILLQEYSNNCDAQKIKIQQALQDLENIKIEIELLLEKSRDEEAKKQYQEALVLCGEKKIEIEALVNSVDMLLQEYTQKSNDFMSYIDSKIDLYKDFKIIYNYDIDFILQYGDYKYLASSSEIDEAEILKKQEEIKQKIQQNENTIAEYNKIYGEFQNIMADVEYNKSIGIWMAIFLGAFSQKYLQARINIIELQRNNYDSIMYQEYSKNGFFSMFLKEYENV